MNKHKKKQGIMVALFAGFVIWFLMTVFMYGVVSTAKDNIYAKEYCIEQHNEPLISYQYISGTEVDTIRCQTTKDLYVHYVEYIED